MLAAWPVRRRPTRHWVSGSRLHSIGPQTLTAHYRRRWRVEPASDELLPGHDVDQRVSTRLQPDLIAPECAARRVNSPRRPDRRDRSAPAGPARAPAVRAPHVAGLGRSLRVHDGIVVQTAQPTVLPPGFLPRLGLTLPCAAESLTVTSA